MSANQTSMTFSRALADDPPAKGLTARDRSDMAAIGKKQQLKVRNSTKLTFESLTTYQRNFGFISMVGK